MRRLVAPFVVVAALLASFAPVRGAQPRCTLDVAACLQQFDELKARPWMGVYVNTDSLGRRVVTSVFPGSPADRAGIRPGDQIGSVGGQSPQDWYATRAGWKDGDRKDLVVVREAREVKLTMECHAIPDETFARIVGEHMVEAHLAYMVDDEDHGVH